MHAKGIFPVAGGGGRAEAVAVDLAAEDDWPRLIEAATEIFGAPDIVVNAVVGAAGLLASVRAVERGARLALANKESIVIAGEPLLRLARERGAEVIPIDSEHSALLQCLRSGDRSEVRALTLTASGAGQVR